MQVIHLYILIRAESFKLNQQFLPTVDSSTHPLKTDRNTQKEIHTRFRICLTLSARGTNSRQRTGLLRALPGSHRELRLTTARPHSRQEDGKVDDYMGRGGDLRASTSGPRPNSLLCALVSSSLTASGFAYAGKWSMWVWQCYIKSTVIDIVWFVSLPGRLKNQRWTPNWKVLSSNPSVCSWGILEQGAHHLPVHWHVSTTKSL